MADNNTEMTENKSEPTSSDEEKLTEITPVDDQEHEGEDYLLEEELPMDKTAADEQADRIPARQTQFTEDEDIEEEFQKRQKKAHSGREALEEDLEKHQFSSPEISGGDLDADWSGAVTGSGAETVGGTEPTPDMDRVDELGKAAGITYEDDEPLNTEDKLIERRKNRLTPPAESTQPPAEENAEDARGEEEE